MGDISNVTGSIPDIAGMVLGLADALSAKEGFSYNLCTFILPFGDQAGGAQAARPSAGVASAQTPAPVPRRSVLLDVQGTFGPAGAGRVITKALIALQAVRTSESMICTVSLEELQGFDTRIGSQMALEMAVESSPGGVMLVIKGFLDPAGFGYAHFLGHVFVRLDASRSAVTTSPVGELRLVQPRAGIVARVLVPGGGNILARRSSSGFVIEFTG